MRYLFIDDYHIERTEGLVRRMHQPVKEPNPVLIPDREWEQGSRVLLWNTPYWDDEHGCWCMLYFGGEEILPLLAVSPDGLEWEKPSLHLVDWRGDKRNNIVNLGFPGKGKQNRVVFLFNDTPEGSHRFKGLTRIGEVLHPIFSEDGRKWVLQEDVQGPKSGDEYRLGYDALNQQYVATVKRSGWEARPVPEFGRAVEVSLSGNFRDWSPPQLVLGSDELDLKLGIDRMRKVVEQQGGLDRGPIYVNDPAEYRAEIYDMPTFTYEDLFLGLANMFNVSGVHAHPEKNNALKQNGILYVELAASRDWFHWRRIRDGSEPFIPLSPVGGDRPDKGMIMPTAPVVLPDELWFYYTGVQRGHAGAIAPYVRGFEEKQEQTSCGLFRARMRRDGFVSLRAGNDPGVLLTKLFEVTGSRLHVNADAGAGELRAEIRDADTGYAIPGFSLGEYYPRRFNAVERERCAARIAAAPNTTVPLSEDTRDGVLCWEGGSDLSRLKGKQIRLQFYLRKADLYSFWFSEE